MYHYQMYTYILTRKHKLWYIQWMKSIFLLCLTGTVYEKKTVKMFFFTVVYGFLIA